MDTSTVKIKAIVTGTTGMVGEGVLTECLQDPRVEAVLVINRKPCGVSHPKLKEIIHKDFFDLSAIEDQLTGYNACYFCLGVSSVGMKEPEYYKLCLPCPAAMVDICPFRRIDYFDRPGNSKLPGDKSSVDQPDKEPSLRMSYGSRREFEVGMRE